MANRFTLQDLIDCADREAKLRISTYPRLVVERKLTQANAELEIAKMEAVRDLLAGMKQRDAAYFDQTLPNNS
jgi:hypothetical protein